MRGALDSKTIGRLSIGLLAGLAAGAAPGQQSEPPGADLFLDLRTGLVVTDNFGRDIDPDGTSTLLETNLTLGLDTKTKNQELSLRLGGLLEYGTGPETTDIADGFTDPFLTIGYALTNKTSELTFNGSIRESDISFNDDEATSGDDLVIDTGTRLDTRANVGLLFGKDGPVETQAGLFFTRTTYDGVSDADLNDTERYGGNLSVRMAVTRAARLSFNATYTQRDEDDVSDTEEVNWSYGLGLDAQLDPSLVLNAALNYAVNELSQTNEFTGIRATDREEGPTFNLGLRKDLKNGTVGAELSSRITSGGTFTSLQFDRRLVFKSGALDAMVGATWDANDDTFGIARIAYTHQMKAAQLQGSLERSVRTSDDDDDELVTGLGLNYLQQLSEVSDVSFAVRHTDVDNIDVNGIDRQQTNISLTYRHQLTQDWSLNAGVSHSVSRSDDRDDITENRVFANIGRRFSLRP